MSRKTKSSRKASGHRTESNPYAPPASDIRRAEAGANAAATVAAGVRFGHLTGAFKVAAQQQGTWIAILLLMMLASVALNFGVTMGMAILSTVIGGTLTSLNAPEPVVAGSVLGCAFLLVLAANAVIVGGLFRTACKQARGERIKVSDASLPIRQFPQVVLAMGLVGLLAFLAVVLVILLVILPLGLLQASPETIQPGLGPLAALALAALAFGIVWSRLMLVIPLVVDGDERAIAAIRKGWVALRGRTFAAVVFHTLAAMFSVLGAILLGFGLLLTLPVYYVAVALVYRDHFPRKSDAPA